VLFNSSLSPDETCPDDTSGSAHTNSEVALIEDIESLVDEQISPLLKDALVSTHGHLTLEERARTLQMIMQCSTRVLAHINLPARSANEVEEVVKADRGETILRLMEELDRTKDDFQLPAIRQRMLYIQMAKTFEHEIALEQHNMEETRRRRRRMQAQGMSTVPQKGSGKTAKSRVLDRLLEGDHVSASRLLKTKLTAYIQIGSNLDYLASRLGTSLLLTFPVDTVLLCDLHLALPSARNSLPSLVKPIEPSAYVSPSFSA
jgi:hypothetical protein